MATVLLLKNNDLTRNTNIGGNVDPDRYWSSVRDAQKTYLKPLIGGGLYTKLMQDFSGGTLTGIYQEMYTDYIKDIIIHQAASLYLTVAAYQVSDAGITKTSTENTTTVDKDEIDYMVFHQRNMAKEYTRQLMEFLRENKADIPEYLGECSRPNNYFGWYLSNNQRHYRGY